MRRGWEFESCEQPKASLPSLSRHNPSWRKGSQKRRLTSGKRRFRVLVIAQVNRARHGAKEAR